MDNNGLGSITKAGVGISRQKGAPLCPANRHLTSVSEKVGGGGGGGVCVSCDKVF